jgi:hypothetical protein
MAYVRKTVDEYQIKTNYGYGWEVENTEDNYEDAKRSLKEYRDNTNAQVKLEKKRVKIEDNKKKSK